MTALTSSTSAHVVTVKRTATGWSITQTKTRGMNKGETVLATFCGGALGERLARQALAMIVADTMPDEVAAEA